MIYLGSLGNRPPPLGFDLPLYIEVGRVHGGLEELSLLALKRGDGVVPHQRPGHMSYARERPHGSDLKLLSRLWEGTTGPDGRDLRAC
jgi:hypothetical protein